MARVKQPTIPSKIDFENDGKIGYALIHLVEDRPLLWDKRHPEFLKHKAKLALWNEITALLNEKLPGDVEYTSYDSSSAWTAMKRKYTNQRKYRPPSGSAASSATRVKNLWQYIYVLEFLDSVLDENADTKGNYRDGEDGYLTDGELTEDDDRQSQSSLSQPPTPTSGTFRPDFDSPSPSPAPSGSQENRAKRSRQDQFYSTILDYIGKEQEKETHQQSVAQKFGETIGDRLEKLSPYNQTRAMSEIGKLLTQAEMANMGMDTQEACDPMTVYPHFKPAGT